jgi:hypothetical protein
VNQLLNFDICGTISEQQLCGVFALEPVMASGASPV